LTGKRLTLAAVAIGVGFLVSIWSVHRLYVAESRLKVLLPSAVPGDPTRRELEDPGVLRGSLRPYVRGWSRCEACDARLTVPIGGSC